MSSVDANIVGRDATVVAEAAKMRFFPFAPIGGDGVWLVDSEGHRMLDFSAGWAVANTGYGDPRIRRAVATEMQRGGYPGYVSAAMQPAVELAEQLLELVPLRSRGAKVWFGHSGSDAIEAAIRMVLGATGRHRLVSFTGSYHGSTYSSAALNGLPPNALYGMTPTSVKVAYPDAYRPIFDTNPQTDEARIIEHLEEYIFETISPPTDTAAIVVEAVQSLGGDLVPSAGFLQALDRLCERHGILLILDEVKVGLGRTGHWFAYEAAGITPDLVVLGKSLGGGLPLSAVIGPREILDATTASAVFTTAGNGPCAAAGIAVLESIREQRLVENAERMGSVLRAQLRQIAAAQPLIGDVRGMGLISGVELVTDPDSKTPARVETASVCLRAAELGLIVFYVGMRSNVLEITPPLTISADEIRLGCELLAEAIGDVGDGRVLGSP